MGNSAARRSWITSCAMLSLWAALGVGCTANIGGGGPSPDGAVQQGLTVSPAQAAVSISPTGAAQTVHFTAKDASGNDVTAAATWALADSSLGSVAAGAVAVQPTVGQGGRTQVSATLNGQTGVAALTVQYLAPDVLGPGSNGSTMGQFTGPSGGTPPQVVYPLDGAMLARNINQMTLAWSGTAGPQYYRITLTSPTYQQTIYATAAACAGAQCSYAVADTVWSQIAHAAAGAQAQLVIASTAGAGQPVASAAPRTLQFSPQDVKGGLYYFTTSKSGLMRLPFGGTTAVPYALGTTSGVTTCIGCHAVSRDGKKVAALFIGPDGVDGIMDGANSSNYSLVPVAQTSDQLWNLASFSPDGSKLITVWNGALSLRNAGDGSLIKTVPMSMVGGKVTMPEWSPDGSFIVFVRIPASGFNGSGFIQGYVAGDWILANAGDIATLPYNGGDFGQSVTVAAAIPGNEYHFYPSISPDSKWIVFNSAQAGSCASDTAMSVAGADTSRYPCVSYDQTAARLRLVRAAANQVPIELTAATHIPNKTTAWPRFAPFQQGNLVFFTYSAKFDYGWVVQQSQVHAALGEYRPQIWMSAIDLGKAGSGTDPSYPPFWLPFQDATTNNHDVIWTEQIACTQASDCGNPNEFSCSQGMCVKILG